MYRVKNLSLVIKSLISWRTATPPVAPAMTILPEDMSEVICEVHARSNLLLCSTRVSITGTVPQSAKLAVMLLFFH